MTFTDLIGWTSAAILLLTIARQVYTEWRANSTRGLSKWLFVGQIAASAGFVVYSVLLENWVFVTVNVFIAGAAVVGQWVYLRNQRKDAAHRSRASTPHKTTAPAAAARASAPAPRHAGTPREPARHDARRQSSGERGTPRKNTGSGTAKGVISGEDQVRAVPPPGALKRPRARRARNLPPR